MKMFKLYRIKYKDFVEFYSKINDPSCILGFKPNYTKFIEVKFIK